MEEIVHKCENNFSTLYLSDGELETDPAAPVDTEVLVLEINRPLTNALARIGELRERYHAARLVICINNTLDPEANDPLRSLAITGCLFKPFDPDELLATIDSFSSNRQSC